MHSVLNRGPLALNLLLSLALSVCLNICVFRELTQQGVISKAMDMAGFVIESCHSSFLISTVQFMLSMKLC